LRDRRFAGVKFRRQTPIGQYVADFCSLHRRLVVEVDGGQHDLRRREDAERTAYLNGQGFRVLRFWNNEVFENLPGVLQTIEKALFDPSP